MCVPGFTAEASLYKTSEHYQQQFTLLKYSDQNGVQPARISLGTFDDVCRALGGKPSHPCHDCGPFGWFTCCDDICTIGESGGTSA